MRKSEYALWALLVLAVLAAGSTMVSLARSQSASAANSEIYRQLDLFGEVLERVRSDYVEKPDDAKLIEAAINGMLTALDPHSAYLNPKHFRDMQVQTRGEFGGLGIEVTMENGVVKVVSPDRGYARRQGGHAERRSHHRSRQGADPGPHLAGSGGEDARAGQFADHAHHRAQGRRRSVRREGHARRDPHQSGEVQRRGNDVGYIRVTTFNEQTTANLQKAIEDLKKQIGPKLKGYVIDLRNNPGGLLDQAISVSDAFLDQGAIVLTKGRNLEETQRVERAAWRHHRRHRRSSC